MIYPKSVLVIFALVLYFQSETQAGKISEGLLKKFSNSRKATTFDVIIELPSAFRKLKQGLQEKPISPLVMQSSLKKITIEEQKPILKELTTLGKRDQATPFWISNDISLLNADLETVVALAKLKEDFVIRKPEDVSLPEPEDVEEGVNSASIQWGVEKIEAHKVWENGTRGEGITVGIIDTGVRGDHEALSFNFGGAWLDPYHNEQHPTDAMGHGTHCAGSIVGTTKGIGVAPGARWIACRGLNNQGFGYEWALKKCGQWMLLQKPHVVSNSWGGGQGKSVYNDMIRAWRMAGIIPVFALGNSGNQCGSQNSPGDQLNLISVGATDKFDNIASFSSRGWTAKKPEISAPGEQVYSAYNTGSSSYQYLSGTSMSTPHTAGAIALMLSRNPQLTFSKILEALQSTAARPQVGYPASTLIGGSYTCSSLKNTPYPNNAYGYGRINVRKAMGL